MMLCMPWAALPCVQGINDLTRKRLNCVNRFGTHALQPHLSPKKRTCNTQTYPFYDENFQINHAFTTSHAVGCMRQRVAGIIYVAMSHTVTIVRNNTTRCKAT